MSPKKIVPSLVLFLFFSLFAAASFAQELSFEAVCDSLSKHNVTAGKFTQTRKTKDRSLTSSGEFLFCRDGILWKTQKPFPSSTIITKNKVLQENASGKRSVIDASQNKIFQNMAASLTSIFGGNLEGLEKNFSVSFSAEGNKWTAFLTPNDSAVSSVIKSIELGGAFLSKTDLSEITMTEAGGNTITYLLSNQNYFETLTNEQKSIFAEK